MKFKLRYLFPRSFLWRTIWLTVIPLLIAEILLANFFYDRHWKAIGEQLANNLTGEVNMFLEEFSESNEQDYEKLFSKYSKSFDFRVEFIPRYFDYDSFKKQKKFQTIYLRDIVKKKIPYPALISLQGKDLEIYIWHSKGLIKIDTILSRVYVSTIHIFLAWIIGTFFFLLLFITPFIRSQSRSIKKLAIASTKFGKGEDYKYSPSGASEIRQAGHAFLVMKARISRFIESRTQMLSAISHDIRTPLTRMKLSLVNLKDKELKQNLLDDIKDIESMVNAYLNFIRDEIKEDQAKINLYDFLKDVVNNTIKNNKKVVIKKFEKEKLLVRVNEFRRAFINILNNACRHANKRVQISVKKDEKYIELIIEDDGAGIPKDMRDEMFKPFATLDKSRNKETGGVGLGLTISKNIIQSHGGKITLHGSKDLGGLKVKITLPL